MVSNLQWRRVAILKKTMGENQGVVLICQKQLEMQFGFPI